MFSLSEGVEHFLDVTKSVGEFALLFEGVRESLDDGEQGNSILVGFREIGMRLELVLKGIGALAENDVIQSGFEVCIFLLFHPVFLDFNLPQLEGNHIGWIRIHWGHRISQDQVSNCLSELGGVLRVCPADIVNNLFRGSDVLIRIPFSRPVVDKAFQGRFSSFKLRLTTSPSVGTDPVITTAITSPPPPGVVAITSCCCCACRWLVATVTCTRHHFFSFMLSLDDSCGMSTKTNPKRCTPVYRNKPY